MLVFLHPVSELYGLSVPLTTGVAIANVLYSSMGLTLATRAVRPSTYRAGLAAISRGSSPSK